MRSRRLTIRSRSSSKNKKKGERRKKKDVKNDLKQK